MQFQLHRLTLRAKRGVDMKPTQLSEIFEKSAEWQNICYLKSFNNIVGVYKVALYALLLEIV